LNQFSVFSFQFSVISWTEFTKKLKLKLKTKAKNKKQKTEN